MTKEAQTYGVLDYNGADSWTKDALNATTSPALWTVYVLKEEKIVAHRLMFSEEDAWEYCEELVHYGLDYEILTPVAKAT